MSTRKTRMRIIAAIIIAALLLPALSKAAVALRPGDFLGNVLNTDIRVFIDDVEIEGFNINGWTYVIAEDLGPYGFRAIWDRTARTLSIVLATPSGRPQPVPVNRQPVGSIAFAYVYTDIRTFINGRAVHGYNIRGRTAVRVDDIAREFGSYVWNSVRRELRVTTRPAHIPVTSITGLPTAATAGEPLALWGTVHPHNATNRAITWSVVSSGGTGATITSGNSFIATSAGTAMVRASVNNGVAVGSHFTQYFNITVGAAVPLTHTVTFDLNGGTFGGSTGNVVRYVTQGMAVGYGNVPQPTLAYHVFVGWRRTAPPEVVTQTRAQVGGRLIHQPMTFTAQWSTATHAVTFNLGGGNVGGSTANIVVHATPGTAIGTANVPQPVRANHTFVGWLRTAPAEATNQTREQVGGRVINQAMTFTAQWTTAAVVTITWNANNGWFGSEAAGWSQSMTTTHTPGSTFGSLPEQPIRSGWIFVGWFTAQTGGTQITSWSTVPNFNTTYYARWVPLSVEITWDANGGTVWLAAANAWVGSMTIPHTPGEPIGWPPTPARAGWTFVGWFTAPTGGTQITSSSIVPNFNTTYWARWVQQ